MHLIGALNIMKGGRDPAFYVFTDLAMKWPDNNSLKKFWFPGVPALTYNLRLNLSVLT